MEVLPTLASNTASLTPTSPSRIYVARETRRHVTVALNGDGGDECFAGYDRHAAMRLAETYRRMPAALRGALIEPALSLVPSSEAKRSYLGKVKRFVRAASLPSGERYAKWVSIYDDASKESLYTEGFRAETRAQRASDLIAPWFALANGAGVVDAALLADTMTYLPNDLLVKVDIASMAVSRARSHSAHHVSSSPPRSRAPKLAGPTSLLSARCGDWCRRRI